MSTIQIQSEELEKISKTVLKAGQTYQTELENLKKTVETITSGALTGDLADELVEKYHDKEGALNGVATAIESVSKDIATQAGRAQDIISGVVQN